MLANMSIMLGSKARVSLISIVTSEHRHTDALRAHMVPSAKERRAKSMGVVLVVLRTALVKAERVAEVCARTPSRASEVAE